MIEGIPIEGLVQFAANFGVAAVVLVIWYVDQRAMANMQAQYREDMAKTLEQYRKDIAAALEQHRQGTEAHWKMYEHNVELVKRYGELAADQKDMILMNTQAWTRTHEAVEGNRFCPMVRLEKKAAGVQG